MTAESIFINCCYFGSEGYILLVATLLDQQIVQLLKNKERNIPSIWQQQLFCSLRAHQCSSNKMQICHSTRLNCCYIYTYYISYIYICQLTFWVAFDIVFFDSHIQNHIHINRFLNIHFHIIYYKYYIYIIYI